IIKLLAVPIFEENVSRFHIYFPDPWPKRRHNPRRLLNEAFFAVLYRALQNSGSIELATDYADYYAAIQKTLRNAAIPWREVKESHSRLFEPDLKTNYELKYEKEGRELFYLSLRK
ncbi:MAG: hypothetical protein Q7S68_00505, partial [Deltaproteobacteria bacterium]|nr:hypothetical protein [Deltaproteobacteria bacterium]